MNEQFSLLIKPASFDCNLRCDYCFYLSKSELFGVGAHRMDIDTLDALTREYLACPMEQYSFGWQGGEPTLAGLDFFQEAIRLQHKYGAGKRIANSIQTNGTLLNGDWGTFLHDNHFLVGISIDGPAKLHNQHRVQSNAGLTHGKVMRGLDILRKNRVEHNVLTLVNRTNQNHARQVYRYLKELGIQFHQYIECVEFGSDGRPAPYAVQQGKWGEFLCQIFDEWYPRDVRTVSVRLFDSILSRLLTGIPTMCSMGGNCCNYLVTEYNGDVFPCDFFVRRELCLGNIKKQTFPELRALPQYAQWGCIKEPENTQCAACPWLPLCMGDCPKNRQNNCSYLCDDWKIFYAHTIERFEQLASSINVQR